jgi:hypothetical protein
VSDQPETGDLDADINSRRDTWVAKDSFNTTVIAGKTDEQLSNALKSNRVVSESLKSKYADHVEIDGSIDSAPSRDRRTVFKELGRIHAANESIKDELRGRGLDFELQSSDEEHPNAAARRISRERTEAQQARARQQDDCWVVTAIYGRDSKELLAAKRVCRARFALNPLVAPSWLLYRGIGPHLAKAASTSMQAKKWIHLLIAEPIIKASTREPMQALAWQMYLAVPGWLCVSILAYLLGGK